MAVARGCRASGRGLRDPLHGPRAHVAPPRVAPAGRAPEVGSDGRAAGRQVPRLLPSRRPGLEPRDGAIHRKGRRRDPQARRPRVDPRSDAGATVDERLLVPDGRRRFVACDTPGASVVSGAPPHASRPRPRPCSRHLGRASPGTAGSLRGHAAGRGSSTSRSCWPRRPPSRHGQLRQPRASSKPFVPPPGRLQGPSPKPPPAAPPPPAPSGFGNDDDEDATMVGSVPAEVMAQATGANAAAPEPRSRVALGVRRLHSREKAMRRADRGRSSASRSSRRP